MIMRNRIDHVSAFGAITYCIEATRVCGKEFFVRVFAPVLGCVSGCKLRFACPAYEFVEHDLTIRFNLHMIIPP
jgi:hypothetical protein